MANGKITLEQFQKLDQVTRDYHIWSKLQILDNLHNRFASKWIETTTVWGMKIIGGIILVALIGLVVIQG